MIYGVYLFGLLSCACGLSMAVGASAVLFGIAFGMKRTGVQAHGAK